MGGDLRSHLQQSTKKTKTVSKKNKSRGRCRHTKWLCRAKELKRDVPAPTAASSTEGSTPSPLHAT